MLKFAYELGLQAAFEEAGLDKEAQGRTQSSFHETAYRQQFPHATSMPANFGQYANQLRRNDPAAYMEYMKNFRQAKTNVQQQVSAADAGHQMPDSRAIRKQLPQQTQALDTVSDLGAKGQIPVEQAQAQTKNLAGKVEQTRGKIQAAAPAPRTPDAWTRGPGVVPPAPVAPPVPAGAAAPAAAAPGASTAAKAAPKGGGMIASMGRFAKGHPWLTAIGAGTMAYGGYRALKPEEKPHNPMTYTY